MRAAMRLIVGGGLVLGAGTSAKAVVIASDSFLTTTAATAGFYTAGNINTQTNTGGTTGYYTGAAAGNQVAGWNSGTGAALASTTGLSHPLTASPSGSANDGSLFAAGNANTRLQYRDLASTSPTASSTYFFSLLARESSNSYTATAYAGVGPSQASGNNAVVPTTGFDIGFVNGALTLFYNNGGASLATQTLVATPTANSTYLVALGYSTVGGTTGTLTPTVYDATGTVVNNPAAQAVTATVNTTTDLGAFQTFMSSTLNNGSPAQINFDEFRFGTTQADVVSVPEPASAGLLVAAGLGLLARRSRRRG